MICGIEIQTFDRILSFPRKIDDHDHVLRGRAKDDLRDLSHVKG
jgi:hypothetical protein